jgi:anaerobic ribonucleoside-triphosphate reductase
MESITVKNTDGFIVPWDRQTIVNQIVKETKLSEIFYNKPAATIEEAHAVAQKAEDLIFKLNIKQVSGPLIREVVNSVLLEEGKAEWRNIMTRVGASVYDAYEIDSGYGFEANDNANQLNNAETSHKRKADKMSKEQNLLLMPEKLANNHLNGDLHCVAGDMPFIYKVDNNVSVTTIKEFANLYSDSIEYLVPSMDVTTHKTSWNRVTRIIKNSPAALYSVTFTKGRSIVCTKDHPFFKTSGNIILKKPRELQQLKVGDRVATLDCIPSVCDGESWYGNLIGFFLGDGTISGSRVCFHLRLPDKIEYIENVLNKLDIEYKKTVYKDGTTGITFYDDYLKAVWNNWKRVPCVAESDILGVIGGLINSDGHIRAHGKNTLPYLEFDNTNEHMFNVYCSLLMMCGVSPSFQEYHCHRSICSGIETTELLCKLRLRDKYAEIVDCERVYGSRERKCWSQLTVKGIEFDRTDETYDITVEENHNFLVGNGFILTGNCHDLEYFGTRPFCQDWDARYCFYYGLMPDGVGTQSSIAKPSLKAEVAILHLVKMLGAAQTNFAGGEGLYNFLTFLAPYFEGKTEKEIRQLMQMFVYEMMQMMCARGGQSTSYAEPLVIRYKGIVSIIPIGKVCHTYLDTPGAKEVCDGTEILSLNKVTGDVEWKPLTAVHVHIPASETVCTRLYDGRVITTTADHSLFTLSDNVEFIETSPASVPTKIITACKFIDPHAREPIKDMSEDIAFLVGVCIGDGSLTDNNGTAKSSMSLCLSDAEVRNKVNMVMQKFNKPLITWHRFNNKNCLEGSFSTTGIPYIQDIGKGAANKHIPDAFLSASDSVLNALLDGLLSTDGNLSRNRYEFCTTSKSLITQVQYIAMRLGLQYCVSERSSESNFKRNYPVSRVQFNAQSSRKISVTNSSRQLDRSFPAGGDYTHHDFSSILKAIEAEYGQGLQKVSCAFSQKERNVKRGHLEMIADRIPVIYSKVKRILPSKIKEITPSEQLKYVYDVSVQDNENFVLANGIVAHNTVFSSVQLTPGVNNLWKDKPIVAFGKVHDGTQAPLRTYGEFEREVRLSFKALMDVMIEGDAIGKPFSFPKPEISMEADFMQEDEEFNKNNPDMLSYHDLYLKAFELAAKFGTPYFDNQLPEYRSSKGGISCYQCCAYQFSADPTSDLEFEDKMNFKNGAHFSMGSWMVMSLNCPRVAYEAEHNDEKLFKGLRTLMDNAIEIFKVKRKWMDNLITKGRIPFASQRPRDPNTGEIGSMAVDFDSLVYTIGVIGINEMVQYHTGKQIHESKEAYKLAIRAMFEMKLYAQELSKENDIIIALARTPAETTAQRFAVSDLLHEEYRDKAATVIKGDLGAALQQIGKTKDLPIYYTNGTHVAVNADITLPERISYEHTFFPVVDGGNILHIWLGEGSSRPEGLMDFAMQLVKNTQVGYFAFTRDMTVCTAEGSVSSGLHDKCPKCGSDKVQHLSRITGYLQAVEGWNAGKRQELKDRKRVEI